MRKLRQVLAFVCALVLVFLFSACGGEPANTETVASGTKTPGSTVPAEVTQDPAEYSTAAEHTTAAVTTAVPASSVAVTTAVPGAESTTAAPETAPVTEAVTTKTPETTKKPETTKAPETTPTPEEPRDPTKTYAIYGAPVIDGEKDALWGSAEINKLSQVYCDNKKANDGTIFVCGAQFRLCYDENYLYYYAEVLDNTMPPEGEGLSWEMKDNAWYNKDGIGLCIAPDGDKSDTPSRLKPAFWFLIRAYGTAANWDQVGQNVFVTEDPGAVIDDQNDFEKHPWANRMYAVRHTTDENGNLNGYVVEGKINLNARLTECGKAQIRMAAGTEIGLEFLINNNNYAVLSKERDYGLSWIDPTAEAYKNNALKGTVVLAEKGRKFVNTAAEEQLTPVPGSGLPQDESAAAAVLAVTPKPTGRAPDRVKNAGNGTTQLYYANTSASELAAYVTQLKNAGFACVSDRTVGANRFTSFVGKGLSVTAYYTDANRTLRILSEPEGNYCSAPQTAYTAVTTPMLTMIGRRFSNNSIYLGEDAGAGLMCFLLRLSDGRFVVIDGGVSDTAICSYADELYARMRAQAVDPNNIQIAAWFFTHSHGDHVGGFKSFVAAYSQKVKIERILYNFPSDADYDAGCDESAAARTSFRTALSKYCADIPQYKIHTGQQYWFADALFEVYYTQEDFITQTRDVAVLSSKNWNNTSAIFSCDIAGQRIMFLGDCQATGNDLTASIFGSYLKSDIVQIAHHGGVGGTKNIYKAVDAKVGLFTTNDPMVPLYINKWDYNKYAVSNLHMQEYFNACDRVTTFALPYTPNGSGFNKSTNN